MNDVISLLKLWKQIEQELRKHGLGKYSLRNYYYEGAKPIIDICREKGIETYDPNAVRQAVQEIANQAAQGIVPERKVIKSRKAESLMQEFISNGTIEWCRMSPAPSITLGDYYQSILDGFRQNLVSGFDLSPKTVIDRVSIVSSFFVFLETSNFYDITEIPFDKVGAFLVLMSVRRPASMERILCALKNLSAYLSNQYHAKSFANALVVKPAPRRKLMPVFSGDDISGIIAQAKQEKQLSLRDSAIYLLASTTGMRCVDVSNLKLDDIDWRNNTIHFVQHKTGTDTILPLDSEAGNAIAEYILHERPKTTVRNVFVRGRAPYTAITSAGIRSRLAKHMDLSPNIDRIPGDRKGFHSIRRYVATSMVNNDVSIEVAKDVIGHLDINSMKHYIRVSENKLSICAISLDGISIVREDYK